VKAYPPEELVAQLSIVQPAYSRGYAIAGVPEFSGLVWEEGTPFSTREVSPTVKLYRRFRCARLSGRKQVHVREYRRASD
jgi:hypothetical protein